MGVLGDWQIRERALAGMITPFEEGLVRPGVLSYGTTSYGYDLRVGRRFRVMSNALCDVIDPKNFNDGLLVEVEGDFCMIPPNSFALAESVETFDIPRDLLVMVVGKSTMARCGIIVNVTPGEPEWKGKWTLEISNTAPLPAKVYACEGIAQAVFFRCDDPARPCEVSYKDKRGIYQGQTGLTGPRVRCG